MQQKKAPTDPMTVGADRGISGSVNLHAHPTDSSMQTRCQGGITPALLICSEDVVEAVAVKYDA